MKIWQRLGWLLRSWNVRLHMSEREGAALREFSCYLSVICIVSSLVTFLLLYKFHKHFFVVIFTRERFIILFILGFGADTLYIQCRNLNLIK